MTTVTIDGQIYKVEIGNEPIYDVKIDFDTAGKVSFLLAKGDKGDPGEPGPANTLDIGTVQKGENAAATITGEAPHQHLNLILPKGDKGNTGAKGETGDTGSLFWTTTVAPVAPNYTFTKSDLAGATGETPKVGDIIFYSYYRYNITSVSDTTVLCATRVSIRGATGAASKWYTGTAITGTSTTATIFSGSGISSAVVGDMYLNTDTGNVYRCTTAGAASAAKWVYTTNIKGDTGATGADGYSPQVTLTQVSATVATLSVTSKDATTGQETTQTVTFGGTYTDGNGVSY